MFWRINRMLTKTAFVLLLAAAVASAKSYTVTLFQPAMFGGVELKAGQYRVEVNEQKAVIRNGKLKGECDVKIENGDAKYDATSVRYENSDGRMKIHEIRLGGTKTKLVFN
jgi:hypothetical protein